MNKNEIINIIKNEISKMLNIKIEDIHDDLSPIELGIDSLKLMKIVMIIRRNYNKIKYSDLIELETFRDWWNSIEDNIESKTIDNKVYIDENEEFELAPMQRAYAVGRLNGQYLGGIASHFYEEFDGYDVDVNKLQESLDLLYKKHGMLRFAVKDDRYGRILETTKYSKLDVYDFREYSKEIVTRKLNEIRKKYSNAKCNIYDGEVFKVAISLLPIDENGRIPTRLHVNLEMVSADAMSLRIIMNDLATAYSKGESSLKQINYNYPSYLRERSIKESREEWKAQYNKDREYWTNKLYNIPDPLSLKINDKTDIKNENIKSNRRAFWLNKNEFERFSEISKKNGLTPSMAFSAAFCEVISAYSNQEEFLINIPLFNREAFHKDVNKLVGDFTSSLLATWRGIKYGNCFLERAKSFQKEFHEDMAHSRYSGLDFLRELSKIKGYRVYAPVVYTSAIGLGELFPEVVTRSFGKPVWIISQGSQVELDSQVTQVEGGLLVNWDSRDDIINSQLVDRLFESFKNSIVLLSNNEKMWEDNCIEVISKEELELRNNINKKAECRVLDRGIHTKFFEKAYRRENNIAILSSDNLDGVSSNKLNHKQLAKLSLELAAYLKECGVKKGDKVIISLPRGSNQIVSILATLALGAVYVPINIDMPEERKKIIIEKVEPIVIIDNSFKPKQLKAIDRIEDIKHDDLAYILFTSGSTGEPKGVKVSQGAALNTIQALNDRYGIDSTDRALALSSIDFDLSVYDIFGMLEVGGGVVITKENEAKNGEAWLELISKYNVTVINCAPILIDILLSAVDNDYYYNGLKTVLLGGDRVPWNIYSRLGKVFENTTVSGLGGTTETAIHSTVFQLFNDMPKGESVPYGWPLKGVKCRVVDTLGRDCPNNVEGELWIGGNSVAEGYLKDNELTNKKFVYYKGTKWYRTGDMAKYNEDACLIFLGRRDNQIKIKGQRIEIGEIENAFERCSEINRACATSISTENGNKICALITPKFYKDNYPRKFITKNIEGVEDRKIEEKLVISFIRSILKKGCIDKNRSIVKLWDKYISKKVNEEMNTWPLEIDKNNWIYEIANRLNAREEDIIEIAKGIKDSKILLDDEILSPGAIMNRLPDVENAISYIINIIDELYKSKGKKIRILELGCLNGEISKRILDKSEDKISNWSILEKSKFKAVKAIEKMDKKVSLIFNNDFILDENDTGDFDLVVSLGTLHTFNDKLENTIKLASILSKKNATLVALEFPKLPPLGYLTAALLEDGFKDINIETYMKNGVEWETLFNKFNISGFSISNVGEFIILLGTLPNVNFKINDVRDEIKNKLTQVMIPNKVFITPSIPLNSNGKIDRKKILGNIEKIYKCSVRSNSGGMPKDGTLEYTMANIWRELLYVDNITENDDFFILGGDSLVATKFIFKAKELGYEDISLEKLFKYPILKDLCKHILPVNKNKAKRNIQIIEDIENRYKPFPSTSVQKAYLIGRRSDMDLGGVSTHVYNEFYCKDFDIKRMEKAINKLVQRHEMLRTVFLEDGRQVILESVPEFRLNLIEGDMKKSEAVEKLRGIMSHQSFNAEKWPLFDVEAITFNENSSDIGYMIGISLDNIVADGLSMMIILSELNALYEDLNVDLDSRFGKVDVSYRDYILAVESTEEEYQKDKEYWKNRVKELPLAPILATKSNYIMTKKMKFRRRSKIISNEEINILKSKFNSEGITLSTIFLAAYCEALTIWSGQDGVSITLTLFDRLNIHENINNIVGDFTTLLVSGYKSNGEESWNDILKNLQLQLWKDLDHRRLSISQVLKMMNRADKSEFLSIPIVFTSALGVNGKYSFVDDASFGKRVFTLSQTPQIWMDFQIRENSEGVEMALDAIEDLFMPGVLDGIWNSIYDTLSKIMNFNSYLDCDIDNNKENMDNEVTNNILHYPIFKNAECNPNKIALIYEEKSLTYKNLCDFSLNIGSALLSKGIKKGDRVVVSLRRGIEQIATVLGILSIGAVYVPISINQPDERKQMILDSVKPAMIIENMDFLNCDYKVIEKPLKINEEDSAYIIFTSGSTGAPKGVEITHGGAKNTINCVNNKWNISKEDTVLNVSSLEFDLSVFDLFGLLGVGGKVVLINDEDYRNPEKWSYLINKHEITIWNSAPALLDMLMIFGRDKYKYNTMRLALVSGDWIPIDLPEKWRIVTSKNSRFVSLGGATEASIWSNFFEVKEVDKSWSSIPYGRPLDNQEFRIIDQRGKDCPLYVTGELWIGGKGLAKGYYNSPEITKEKFVLEGNKRWYKTGDLGRFLSDGNIEFIGRKDNQVKIRGHRIEIGEIEQALKRYKLIKDAVVIVLGDKFKKRLVAFYSDEEVDVIKLKEYLKKVLPSYSIPNNFYFLKTIPINSNGKVDRKALNEVAVKEANKIKQAEEVEVNFGDSKVKRCILDLWEEILGIKINDLNQNLFNLGADSLAATRFVENYRRREEFIIPLSVIFENPSVNKLALYIGDNINKKNIEEGDL